MSRGAAKRPYGLHELAVSNRRTVGLSEGGWVYKGAGTPFVRGQAANWLVRIQTAQGWSMGFGESEVSPLGAIRLNAFDAPIAKRDATGEVPHEMQNGLPCQDVWTDKPKVLYYTHILQSA